MLIKHLYLFFCLLLTQVVFGQELTEKIKKSIEVFEKDPQLENGLFSIYVMNADTKTPVFAKNENIGLATASCLKILTSATAFQLLGTAYQFVTSLSYTGKIEKNTLNGNLVIRGSGDPTLGSWRWEQTKTTAILNKITAILQKKGIQVITGSVIIYDGNSKNVTPGNWIWEDLGNYYGAPARVFNWRENQYDLHFATGKNVKDRTSVVNIDPDLPEVSFENEVTTAESGTGDQSVIYLPPFGTQGVIKGTLPANESDFVVSGSMPNPTKVFAKALFAKLKSAKISTKEVLISTTEKTSSLKEPVQLFLLDTILSPSLDKINYWFMQKSINLYGEAFLNKIGELQNKTAGYTNRNGVEAIKKFWSQKGIPVNSMNIYDGSGLSPANRVTTKTLVSVLSYAKEQPWFTNYFAAFPLYNEMKLKSGTIGDVKGFSGYHTAKDGTNYIVSFLVNNYNGSSRALVNKMYKVLDQLK